MSQSNKFFDKYEDDDFSQELTLAILSQGGLFSQDQNELNDCHIESTQSSISQLNCDPQPQNSAQISYQDLQLASQNTQTTGPSEYAFLSGSSQSQNSQTSTSHNSTSSNSPQNSQNSTSRNSRTSCLMTAHSKISGDVLNGSNLAHSFDTIKSAIKLRLEILCKALHGKGLFFEEKVLVAKKCWKNPKFKGSIRLDMMRADKIMYKKISKLKRIALLMMTTKIYLLIENNQVITRRQLYYEYNGLLSPVQCYELIEMICAFVCVSRRELGIVATGKGLVVGDLSLVFENKARINGLEYKKGFLVPDSLIYCTGVLTNARYVLVVEKDAIFKTLVESQFHIEQNAILITSKGFPDVYTRELVSILSERYKIITFGLFDCDPFGFDIYCTFKFGSINLVHHSYKISCPSMIWLGVFPTEITRLKLKNTEFAISDHERLKSLLDRCYIHLDPLMQNELQYIDQIKVKSGIEDLNGLLFNYIHQKVERYLNDCSNQFDYEDNPFVELFRSSDQPDE